jgi:small subunit ribosomal protein S20
MANHASALKRNRQNQRRKSINQMNRQKLRTGIKKLKAAITAGNADEARTIMPQTFGLIDQSVQKGVITANTARRYKSRMHRNVNSLS